MNTRYFTVLALVAAAGCARHESTGDAGTPASAAVSAAAPAAVQTPPAPAVMPSSMVDLRRPEVVPYVTGFWPQPNPDSRWTVAKRVEIKLSDKSAGPTTLKIIAGAFLIPNKVTHQRVVISVNGKAIGKLDVEEAALKPYTLKVPAGVWTGENRVVLELPDADSPLHLEAGKDDRVLGLAIQSIEVVPGS